jgi:hypothetical protein
MATATAYIDVPPEDAFAVLADGWYYSGRVVGNSHHNRVSDAVLHRRNGESLAQLAAMSEHRTAPRRSSRWPTS